MHLTLISLNQDFPILRREDLTGKPAVLYSQTSSRPQGVARELPKQQSSDCLTHDVRVFYARCASVCAQWARGRKGEGSDDWLFTHYLFSVVFIKLK